MKPQKNTGFTLVEAIVTLAVVAIITTLAMPSFTNLLNKRRISASAHTLYSGLQEARSVAISEGTQVSTCLSADGLQCKSYLAQGSSGHFISFRGTTVPTAGTWGTVGIRAVPINTQAGKISLSKFGGPSTQVQFQADGITLNSAQNGSFTLLGSDSTMTQKVVVARTGRVSIQ